MISLDQESLKHFKEQKKILFILHEKSLEYFKIIEKLVAEEEPSLPEKWQENTKKLLEKVDGVESSIQKLKEKQKIGEFFNNIIYLYDSFSEINALLEFIMDVVQDKKYLEKLLYNMSRTYVDDVKRKAELIAKIHEEYQEKSGDENVMESIYEKLNVGENLPIISARIESVDKPNDFLVFLISKIVEKFPKGTTTRAILDKLELLKDSTLGVSGNRYYNPSGDLPLIQRLLVGYGLVPVMGFSGIDEIYNELGEKAPEGASLDDLKERYGVLHFDRHSDRLISFNIRALIDKKYVIKEGLETASKSGLNKKIVRRFNTITSLPLEFQKDLPRDEIYETNANASKHIIIDSVSNQYYRLLSNSYDSPFVSREVIDKVKLGALKRSDAYAKVQEEAILEKGINHQHRNIIYEFYNFQESLPPIELLKEKIVIDIRDYFEKTFKPPAKDFYKDVRRFIVSKPLLSKINDIIAFRTYERLFEKGEKVKTEKKLSFLKNLNKALGAFQKTYLVAMSSLIVDDIFIKYSKGEYELSEDPKKDVAEMYMGKVREVVEDMDSKPSEWEQFDPTLKDYVFARQLYSI